MRMKMEIDMPEHAHKPTIQDLVLAEESEAIGEEAQYLEEAPPIRDFAADVIPSAAIYLQESKDNIINNTTGVKSAKEYEMKHTEMIAAVQSVMGAAASRAATVQLGSGPSSRSAYTFYEDRTEIPNEIPGNVTGSVLQSIAAAAPSLAAPTVSKALLVGVWDYKGIRNDHCSVCRLNLMELCMLCAGGDDDDGRNSPHKCVVAVLECGHAEHVHCIDKWKRSTGGSSKDHCLACRQPYKLRYTTRSPYSLDTLEIGKGLWH